MDDTLRTALAPQFGGALAMLENAITACPDPLWSDHAREPQFWYVAYHTLFWLDFYLSETADGFAPPPPFGLEEMDPAGLLPPRVYTRDELLAYLAHGRAKLRPRLAGLVGAAAHARVTIGSFDGSVAELQLYSLRHVHHHVGQLQLMLRHAGVEPPRWVRRVEP